MYASLSIYRKLERTEMHTCNICEKRDRYRQEKENVNFIKRKMYKDYYYNIAYVITLNETIILTDFNNFLMILNEIINFQKCPKIYKWNYNQRLMHVTINSL